MLLRVAALQAQAHLAKRMAFRPSSITSAAHKRLKQVRLSGGLPRWRGAAQGVHLSDARRMPRPLPAQQPLCAIAHGTQVLLA